MLIKFVVQLLFFFTSKHMQLYNNKFGYKQQNWDLLLIQKNF